MLTKLATAVIYLLVGVGLGYIVWGIRVGELTQSLNHLVLEEDARQSRLLDGSSSEAQEALATALDDLGQSLRDQSIRIAQQAEAIEGITGEKTSSLQGELAACGDRRARLEHDLEKCLFDKSALERKAEAAVPVAPPARSGSSPVERTVTYPSLPGSPGVPGSVDAPVRTPQPPPAVPPSPTDARPDDQRDE